MYFAMTTSTLKQICFFWVNIAIVLTQSLQEHFFVILCAMNEQTMPENEA